MCIPELEKSVQCFLEAGLTDYSKRVYKAGWQQYLAFCQKFALPSISITQENATLFVAFLGAEGLAGPGNLATLPAHGRPNLHGSFFSYAFPEATLEGHQEGLVTAGATPMCLPITGTLMHRIKTALTQNSISHWPIMVWAACCTGFFGFLRCSELLVPDGTMFNSRLHLSVANLEFTRGVEQDLFLIGIKESKTDQLRTGEIVALGSTKTELCPIAALLDYLNRRRSPWLSVSITRRYTTTQAGLR